MTQAHRADASPTTADQEGRSVSTHAVTLDPSTTAHAPDPLSASLPCHENPADLWFAELPEHVERAKALCAGCPLRVACLAGALERGEPWGVWGGQLLLSGVVVPRKRPRGRPRKNQVAA